MTLAIANRQRLLPLDRPALRALCRRILAAHGSDADLSLCFVDNAAIRALNARYLGHDHITDVLAFPFADAADPTPDRLLGEIIVSVEKALAEARRRRIPPERELALYTAHGLLHLLGYDDHTPAHRRRMRRAERLALDPSRR
ncbi:MAG: rRNA maturation RNase YbeY [Planctomycetes bacterium]|nr:rRNA maturation RNase YbeY [Planctomycetota bacterium]